jgi:Ca-activated chloride channel family protein
MSAKPRTALIACVAIAVLLTGCCPASEMVEKEIVVTRIVEKEGESVERLVVATPAEEAPYPSTGGETPPNDEPYDAVFYKDYGVNPFIDTEDDHLSTFAIDVDTGSYSIMRRYVSDGYLPPEEAVRVEEYVNYFDQGYEPPSRGEGAFAVHLDGAPSRFGDEKYHLVRVGLQGYEVPAEERKDVVLTFVIDVSGSMDRENRLELVKDALHLLVDELGPQDQVGIVIYGSQAEVALEHTYVGKGYRRILKVIDRLQPSGSTYAEAGLRLAYQEAYEAFDPNATNRVILCSDGVANVGNTGHESIWEQIREYADEGIYLTTLGFGMGNYNDVLMEQLADHGDGFYAYVDTIEEAERVFVDELTSTMEVIAKDAKVQVEFNPAVVSRFRLIGYENRDVADEDFRDDTVDGGEIGAGHSVTALYELKFHPEADESQPALIVYLRYQEPDTGEVIEISRSMTKSDLAPAFEEAPIHYQWTAVVAEYAEILHGSYWARGSTLEDVRREVHRIAEYMPGDTEVAEFVDLVDWAVRIGQ